MRVLPMIPCIFIFLISCSTSKEKRIHEILKIAVDYASGQVRTPGIRTGKDGVTIVGDEKKSYIIDPSALFNGLIDDDEKEDAIISISTYENRFLGPTEHLFIMNINNRLVMQRSFESDMKILGLKDRVITAEVPEHPRTSPLFNCPECREIVHYRYKMGELVPVDSVIGNR